MNQDITEALAVNDTAKLPVQLSTRARYPMHTYSMRRRINLKQAADTLFPGVTERYGNDCLIFHIGHTEKILIFLFGTVVFFNVPPNAHQNYLTRLGVVPEKNPNTSTPVDELAEDEVTLTVEPDLTEVGFNSATIPEFDISFIHITAQVLAQSSALELIEWEVEEFITESERLILFLKGREYRRPRRKELLRFIGDGLSAKHRIVAQLALLNEPEKTWEREELYKFYRALYANFEIRDRIEKIEKMLALTSEVSELIFEIVQSRRSEILEIIIIALIAFEVIKSFAA